MELPCILNFKHRDTDMDVKNDVSHEIFTADSWFESFPAKKSTRKYCGTFKGIVKMARSIFSKDEIEIMM